MTPNAATLQFGRVAKCPYSYTSYDTTEGVKQSTQTLAVTPLRGGTAVNASYGFSYTYNKAGGLQSETCPTQRSVKTCYDVAGRISSVQGTTGNMTKHTGTPVIPEASHASLEPGSM